MLQSESLLARSSQSACIKFRSGDESWCSHQATIASFTSPWGNFGLREGSKRLARSLQACDDDSKHGRDRSAAERRQRPACLIGGDACDQFSFPKDTLHILSMLVYGSVEHLQFLFVLEACCTTQKIYEFGDWESFKMKNAWCVSIAKRFSMMLSITFVFASKCSEADSWCRWDPNNSHCLGDGFDVEMDRNLSWNSTMFGAVLCLLCGW